MKKRRRVRRATYKANRRAWGAGWDAGGERPCKSAARGQFDRVDKKEYLRRKGEKGRGKHTGQYFRSKGPDRGKLSKGEEESKWFWGGRKLHSNKVKPKKRPITVRRKGVQLQRVGVGGHWGGGQPWQVVEILTVQRSEAKI